MAQREHPALARSRGQAVAVVPPQRQQPETVQTEVHREAAVAAVAQHCLLAPTGAAMAAQALAVKSGCSSSLQCLIPVAGLLTNAN